MIATIRCECLLVLLVYDNKLNISAVKINWFEYALGHFISNEYFIIFTVFKNITNKLFTDNVVSRWLDKESHRLRLGFFVSAEFGEDQRPPRPAAKTDRRQTAAGQRSAGRGRGETQERERIRELELKIYEMFLFESSYSLCENDPKLRRLNTKSLK